MPTPTTRLLPLLSLLALAAACSSATLGVDGGGGGGSGGGTGTAEVCNNSVDDDKDSFTDCSDPDCCQAPSCFSGCVDLCTDTSTICDITGVRRCSLDVNTGCRRFGTGTPCPQPLVCSGGDCLTTCRDQCTENERQC